MSESTIKGINHVGVSVSDLDATIALYTSATGLGADGDKRFSNLEAQKASGFANMPLARAALTAPNGHIELCQYDPAQAGPAGIIPVKGPGVTHMCLQSPTPEDIYGRFKSLGATPVSRGDKPVDLGGYGVYYAYSRDKDGIMFETEHLDQPRFEGPVWLSHVALVSPDIDRLVDFYQTLLGFEPNRRNEGVRGSRADAVTDLDDVNIRAAWFDTSNMILELWQFTSPPTPEAGSPLPIEKIGYNKFAFETDDIEAEYKRLTEAGVEFLSAPVKTDESTEVYARDPDGNLFSLIQPAAGSPISIDNLKSFASFKSIDA